MSLLVPSWLLICYDITMRLAFLSFLLLAVITGSGYIYLTTIALCVTPIYYRIGDFDDRFSISQSSSKEAVSKAGSVWESLTNRDLFIYDEKAKFTINFIYDDRQEIALDQHDTEARLNTVEEQNKKIEAEFKALERTFIQAKEQYEQSVASYNLALNNLNEKIDRFNASNAPTQAEERQLHREQAALERDAMALDVEVGRLNQMSDELNSLVQRGNVMVELYNQGVQSYNSRFGEAHEFTQGDYRSNQINIYTFLNEEELIRVLVHELGHSLGIGHVENEESMMYHMMSNQPKVASLSREDEEAFFATCGADTDFKNRLITRIVTYLRI
ncbi:MAG: matrixin family metalloprotease [Candidatus Paceibacteria bacterium]